MREGISTESALKHLAQLVLAETGLGDTAETIVALAKENLECDFAGITIRRRHGLLESLAVTDPIVALADRLQYAHHEGPCVEALMDQEDYASEDVATDPRWPTWGPAARELGVQSLLAVKLTSMSEEIGALNLYSVTPRTFSAEDISTAHVFAHHAAVALSSARHVAQLHQAIESRTLIGQAQGILMERFGLDADGAFWVLRTLSQDRNIKLRIIADELIESRMLAQGRVVPRAEEPTKR